jgi:hypothetical protein
MRQLRTGSFFLIIFLLASNAFAWNSESGGGVVSQNEAIVRASLEATQVLESDLSSILYGTTVFGGSTTKASINSSGVLYFGGVTASNDTTWFSNNQYQSWVTSKGSRVRTGLQSNDVYLIDGRTSINGRLSADGIVVTSINTTNVMVSGNQTITSTYTTGTCSFSFNNGILQTASC